MPNKLDKHIKDHLSFVDYNATEQDWLDFKSQESQYQNIPNLLNQNEFVFAQQNWEDYLLFAKKRKRRLAFYWILALTSFALISLFSLQFISTEKTPSDNINQSSPSASIAANVPSDVITDLVSDGEDQPINKLPSDSNMELDKPTLVENNIDIANVQAIILNENKKSGDSAKSPFNKINNEEESSTDHSTSNPENLLEEPVALAKNLDPIIAPLLNDSPITNTELRGLNKLGLIYPKPFISDLHFPEINSVQTWGAIQRDPLNFAAVSGIQFNGSQQAAYVGLLVRVPINYNFTITSGAKFAFRRMSETMVDSIPFNNYSFGVKQSNQKLFLDRQTELWIPISLNYKLSQNLETYVEVRYGLVIASGGKKINYDENQEISSIRTVWLEDQYKLDNHFVVSAGMAKYFNRGVALFTQIETDINNPQDIFGNMGIIKKF